MSQVEDDRLFEWNTSLETRAASIRSRRLKLDEKTAVCLQLEASLVELANENDATERLLSQKERYLASRMSFLEQADAQRAIRRSTIDGETKKATIDAERVENTLNNEWRMLEDEGKTSEIEHQQKLNRLQYQLEELNAEETVMVEKLRQLQDAELTVTNQMRQLKQRETHLRSLTEATLRQMREELREREGLLER